jgi:large subunit GTPase 1
MLKHIQLPLQGTTKGSIQWTNSQSNACRLEEDEGIVLTPFEKNLEVWRQLWRVVERSDVIVQVVDARDPLFYRSVDLESYAR